MVDNLLQRRCIRLELLIDLGLIRSELGIEVLAIGACLHRELEISVEQSVTNCEERFDDE